MDGGETGNSYLHTVHLQAGCGGHVAIINRAAAVALTASGPACGSFPSTASDMCRSWL